VLSCCPVGIGAECEKFFEDHTRRRKGLLDHLVPDRLSGILVLDSK